MIYTCTFAWAILLSAIAAAIVAVVLVRLLMGDTKEQTDDDGRGWRRD